MKYKECFISWCWSQTLSIILRGLTTLIFKPRNYSKTNKIKFILSIYYNNINKDLFRNVELFRPWGLRASSLEASGFYDTNLNTLSTQTPRGQELLEHIKKEWQIKIMAVISSSLMKRVLNFMHNAKLVHILVILVFQIFKSQCFKNQIEITLHTQYQSNYLLKNHCKNL